MSRIQYKLGVKIKFIALCAYRLDFAALCLESIRMANAIGFGKNYAMFSFIERRNVPIQFEIPTSLLPTLKLWQGRRKIEQIRAARKNGGAFLYKTA